MTRTISIALWGLAGWLGFPIAPATAQPVTVLHTFTGGVNDGGGPLGSLLLSGSALYGLTEGGGTAGDGTMFKIGTDGSGYGVMHSFAGLPNDGSNPFGSLIKSGSILYGMTLSGGSANGGTVFQVGTNGAGLNLLHQFAGGATDGAGPGGSLIQSGPTFYGFTTFGGSANLGTVFKTGTDGSGFTLLHTFAGGPSDGQRPNYGTPVPSGSTLYGMTVGGGTADFGTVFKIGTDGTGLAVLHSFDAATGDGWQPYGSLVLSGTTLYGMTRQGGGGAGSIFRINTDGGGYAIMHAFAGGPGDGANPDGDLTLVGSEFYGMTFGGGSDALGTLFGIGVDGSNYTVLHSFLGGSGDGASPIGDLILSGSTLYGMTNAGGSSNLGVVFSFPIAVPEPSSLGLLAAAGGSLAFWVRRRMRKNTRGCSVLAIVINQ